jgi:hypothetical protein
VGREYYARGGASGSLHCGAQRFVDFPIKIARQTLRLEQTEQSRATAALGRPQQLDYNLMHGSARRAQLVSSLIHAQSSSALRSAHSCSAR